jgi:hypothetical protein
LILFPVGPPKAREISWEEWQNTPPIHFKHYLAGLGAPIAAAAFLSASVGAEADWFDIASDAFLSAAAETAGAETSFPVPAVLEFCADGDWIKTNTVTEAAATHKNFLRSSLIVSPSKDYSKAGQSVYPGSYPK